MNITLKKLKVYPRLSEETTAFNADVFIDGILRAYAQNTGKGGMTHLEPAMPNDRVWISKAEKWAKTLPSLPSEHFADGLPMSLDLYIDMLVQVYETYKLNKKAGFVLWEEAKKFNPTMMSVYPEFKLWKYRPDYKQYASTEIL